MIEKKAPVGAVPTGVVRGASVYSSLFQGIKDSNNLIAIISESLFLR